MRAHRFALILGCLVSAGTSFAQPSNQNTGDVLRQAMAYQIRFRSGDLDVVPAYVAMLESATSAEPDNADLWNAMGVAYLAQAARAMMPGGNLAEMMPAIQKGPAALDRALQLNPDHAEALAQRGGLRALMASFAHAPAMAANGVAEMNRAIELAPRSTRVRLLRAFNGLSLPDDLRNHGAEAEDLDFLVKVAAGSRAGDYMRIMRGDLYFETGTPDLAHALYQTVEKSSSPAATDAKARLSALERGGVPMSEIKALRTAAGSKCAMCHGK